MKILCIYCPELPERFQAAKVHFADMGVPAQFIAGIHAQTFGILAWRPYILDNPALGYVIPMAHVGLCLSHYMVWTAASFLDDDDDHVMIVEDDAEFTEGWEGKMADAMADVPADWDILLVGSSNTSDKPKEHVKGDIFIVKYPFCTHAYLVRKKALPVLLARVRDASLKIDVALITLAYPHLNVYAILPRLIHQRGTELAP